jgi:hypothetical protein
MSDSNSRLASLKSLAIGVAAVAITVVVMLVVFRRATNDKNPATAPSELASTKLQSAREQAAALELAETEVMARLAREYFLTQVRAVADDVSALEAEITLWKTEIDSMFTSELGSRIAGSSETAQNFQAMYERQKPDAAKAATLRSAVELLRKQVETPHTESSSPSLYVPSDEFKQELAQIGLEASQMLQQQKQARLDILALGHGQAPANMTLRQKLDELDRLARENRANAIREAETKAFDAATSDLVAAKEAAVREREKVKVDEVNREIAAAKHEQRLEEVRKNRQMLSIMEPLSGKGYLQPGKVRTLDAGPVSFASLASGGYLDESFRGLERFLMFMHSDRENDRTVWVFPAVRLNGAVYKQLPEATQMKLRAVQKFVTEYGNELVELEYLAK